MEVDEGHDEDDHDDVADGYVQDDNVDNFGGNPKMQIYPTRKFQGVADID